MSSYVKRKSAPEGYPPRKQVGNPQQTRFARANQTATTVQLSAVTDADGLGEFVLDRLSKKWTPPALPEGGSPQAASAPTDDGVVAKKKFLYMSHKECHQARL